MSRKILIPLLVLLIAAPAAAYTIYLKDGSRLIAREKYTVEDGKAIIVLQSGTQTFIDASEIDVERTEAANKGRYGTALHLEEGRLTDTPSAKPPAPRRDTLTDVAGRSGATPRRPVRRAPREGAAGSGTPQIGPDGSVDLATLPRRAYRDLDIAAEIQRIFRSQGIEEIKIYQGTQSGTPLLEVTANSEASVFRSLETAANALVHVRTEISTAVETLELVLATASRSPAGQFVLTPSAAQALAGKELEASAFFVQNVRF